MQTDVKGRVDNAEISRKGRRAPEAQPLADATFSPHFAALRIP
jgi:hypothetical protein